jgi:hypothetical protein
MLPLAIGIVVGLFAAAVAFSFVLDAVKIGLFSRLAVA